MEKIRISVVGGAGHVGLPLSLVLADRGFPVVVIDSDEEKLGLITSGKFPFFEEDGDAMLARVLKECDFRVTSEYKAVKECNVVILTVGTPIDEHLNPDLRTVYKCIEQAKPYMSSGQVVVMRSTVFPGTSARIHSLLRSAGLDVGVSFCPERIVQGKALKELPRIPQIVSGTDERALSLVREIFSSITPAIVELSLIEAEIAKLFSNAWRYIKFAVANQFYMIATEKGLDFYKIRDAMVMGYERAADFPGAGFTAGPCLFKDTMQLAAFHRQQFALGHAAMLINETLPDFLIEEVKKFGPISRKRIGILGMAYKPDSDDSRESLAYKLRRLLRYEGASVLCTDPYIQDPEFLPLREVLDKAEVLIFGCPHSCYQELKIDGRPVVDCWGFTRRSPSGIGT